MNLSSKSTFAILLSESYITDFTTADINSKWSYASIPLSHCTYEEPLTMALNILFSNVS